jgi:protein involved in polysaccharide export with SLBB domain
MLRDTVVDVPELTNAEPHWKINPFGNLVYPLEESDCVYPVVPAVSIQISPAAEAVGVEPVTKT